MKQLLQSLWTKSKAIILYPVAVCIVTTYSIWEFTRLWLRGYAIENIFQILFVDLQHNVHKLIKRSVMMSPLFYFMALYLIFGSLAAIWGFFTHLLN